MNVEDVRKLSVSTELSLNYVVKDLEISKILKILESKIKNIILKGGTGINRVYISKNNRRFSEDIVFDIYSTKAINDIKKEIYSLLIKQLKGYDVQKPRIMNNTIRFDVYFAGLQKDKIKLEFHVVSEQIFKKPSLKIIDYGFVPFSSSLYPIYSKEELIVQKLCAFINRIDGKDAYDLYYLFNEEYDQESLKKTISKYNTKNKTNLIKETIKKINLLLEDKKQLKYLENSINHYIPKSKRQLFFGLLNCLKDFLEKI